MFILHGTFDVQQKQFRIWAEQDHAVARKKGRQSKIARHPFSVSASELSAHIIGIAPEIHLQSDTAIIWLPSAEKSPQPSVDLAAMGAFVLTEQTALTLAPWQIDTVLLSVAHAIDFLLALPEIILNSTTMRYWHALTVYALSIVADQQVIPALEKNGEHLRALWKPQYSHYERLEGWSKALPPACRAITDTPELASPPGLIVVSWLDAVVDQTVRDAAQKLKTVPKPKTPGAKWTNALVGSDSTLTLSVREADELYKAWETWVGQSEVSGTAAFRITFRLDSPDDPDDSWSLHYLLQATDDPSLIVTAGQIWREKRQELGYLHRRFDQPQERLLAGLGFASRVFPPIERSLHSVAPEQAKLKTDEAFNFLQEAALLLQNSGFRVMLPRWWGGKTARITVRAKVKSTKSTGKSILTMDTLLNCQWEVMLGGQPISFEEFNRLAQLKQPLVQLRGQWVTLDQKQIEAGLKLFQKSDGQFQLDEAIRLGLNGADDVNGIVAAGLDATGWFKTLLNSLRNPEKIETLVPPPDLQAQLRPYQIRGYSWLAFMRRYGLGACLADDMGLGKTIQSIALLLQVCEQVKSPALIICPTSVTGNWRREINRFAPNLKVMTHHGADRVTGNNFAKAIKPFDIVITSYPLLVRDRETLEALDWSTIILDEAQNIKNPVTKQAQAARALKGTQRIALTGTPVENRLSELWSILNFLNPGYLSTEASFRRDFANPIERTNDREKANQLRLLTAPFILRRLKTDSTIISDLPEKQEMKVYCTLTTEQGTLYQATVNNALEAIQQAETEGDAMSRRGLILSMLGKLKQICNHPAQFLKESSPLEGRSGKLARLVEMLEEVYAAGDRALIFTQFAEMGELLRQHLRNTFYDEPLWLHGTTPTKDRDEMVRRFQAPKGPTIFLLSLKAGGVGLNLTNANHVFHYDRWWNPAVENQATDRAFRIGQKRNVQVHKYICAGTLEEKIDEMIESKKALAASVMGNDESWLTELSTDSLRTLVELRQSEIE